MMTMKTTLFALFLSAITFAPSCLAFVPSSSATTTTSTRSNLPSSVAKLGTNEGSLSPLPKKHSSSSSSSSLSLLYKQHQCNVGRMRVGRLRYGNLDDHESAEPLQFSAQDLARIAEISTRGTTMPIVILDSVLPGQQFYIKSSDPMFDELIEYALKDESPEIGILGFHPHTGQPLNMGVTAQIKKEDIVFGMTKGNERVIATSFTGQRRFEVVGEPWQCPKQSFWMANVDIVENRHETLPADMEDAAMTLYDTIPGLVQEWVDLILKTERMKPDELNRRLKDMGELPKDVTQRAMWVGALVNPVPPINVCMEIRPALLACRNIHDRMILTVTALRASIDHMSGKRPLF